MKTDYYERKENKLNYYAEKADKLKKESDNLLNAAHAKLSAIPFGQPILIRHYSKKRDRKYRESIDNTMRKAFETEKKAEYYDNRYNSAINNNAISSDDPEAIKKLEERIALLVEKQTAYKTINKIIKSTKLSLIEKKEKIKNDLNLKESTVEKLFIPDCFGGIGIQSFTMTNNNANIRRLKERKEYLKKLEAQTTKIITIGDITIMDNVEDNRIQINFPGIPEEKIRKELKFNGFKWSPYLGVWQRMRGNGATYAAQNIIKMLKEKNI